MAIEDKHDKQIQDLLENDYPIKAIPIDFSDLNNRMLVLKSSFPDAFAKTEVNEYRSNWYYMAQLVGDHIDIIGVVQMSQSVSNYLTITHFEVNKVFRRQGKTKEILDYLKRFAKFRHFKGIMTPSRGDTDRHFIRNGFIKERANLEWKNNDIIV